jgi:hypothetical protein
MDSGLVGAKNGEGDGTENCDFFKIFSKHMDAIMLKVNI